MAKKNNVRLIGTSIASGGSKNYAALPIKVKDKQIDYSNEEKEALAKVVLETNASNYDFFENEELVTVEEPIEEAPVNEAVEEVIEEAPTEETVEEAIEEAPAEEAVEETIEEAPANEAVEETIEEAPTEETVEETIEEAPAEEIVEEAIEETPVNEVVEGVIEEAPAEETVEETIEEAPAEETVEETIEEAPAEEIVEEAIEEAPTEETVEEAIKETPVNEVVEEVIEEAPTEETVEETIEEAPANEVVEEVIDEAPVNEVVEEVIDEAPVNETVEEAIEETPANEAVEETIEEAPAEEIVEETIEEAPAEEATEETIKETVEEAPIADETPVVEQVTPISASRGSYTVTDDKGLVHLKRKKKGLSLTTKKALSGWLFVLPFLIGIIFIYAPIIVDSISFSFSDNASIMSGEGLENVGFDNYKELFNPTDPEVKGKQFTTSLIHGFRDLVIQIPAIVIFALFMAIILNQNMKGRGFFRAIFFLPVILGAGIIDQLQSASQFLNQAEGATGSGMDGGAGEEAAAGIVSSLDVEMLLSNIKLGTELVDIVTMLINSIFDIVSRSGVQMLIFLSGLQSISPAIYESCQVEGATAWETFWKITLPMISPMILVNAVYTIIDMFTAADNRVMRSISDMISGGGMSSMKPGLASAMGWTYIGVILVVIVLIAILMKSVVFYQRRD